MLGLNEGERLGAFDMEGRYDGILVGCVLILGDSEGPMIVILRSKAAQSHLLGPPGYAPDSSQSTSCPFVRQLKHVCRTTDVVSPIKS